MAARNSRNRHWSSTDANCLVYQRLVYAPTIPPRNASRHKGFCPLAFMSLREQSYIIWGVYVFERAELHNLELWGFFSSKITLMIMIFIPHAKHWTVSSNGLIHCPVYVFICSQCNLCIAVVVLCWTFLKIVHGLNSLMSILILVWSLGKHSTHVLFRLFQQTDEKNILYQSYINDILA